jgi:hypothetical protein
VNWVNDPVDSWVFADSLVAWVDENHFVVFVGRVLVDPVRVENSQVGAAATNSLFGGGAKRSLVLELVDTLVGGLAVGGTLARRSLATTTTNADAVDDKALLGLVSETASLVGTRRTRSAVNYVELTILAIDCTLSIFSYDQRVTIGKQMLPLKSHHLSQVLPRVRNDSKGLAVLVYI